MTYESYYPSYLYHHGVRGMKWGKRKAKNVNISAKHKKAVKIGKTIALTSLAIVGGIAISRIATSPKVSGKIYKAMLRRENKKAMKSFNKGFDEVNKAAFKAYNAVNGLK